MKKKFNLVELLEQSAQKLDEEYFAEKVTIVFECSHKKEHHLKQTVTFSYRS